MGQAKSISHLLMDLNTEYWQEIRYLSLTRLMESDSLDGANEFSALLVELNNYNNAFKSVSLRFLSVMQSLDMGPAHTTLLIAGQVAVLMTTA